MVLKTCSKLTMAQNKTSLKSPNDINKIPEIQKHDTKSKESFTKFEEYNPHDYGNQIQPTIFWGPVFHLLKTIVGTGILILPYTFQTVGYLTGIVGTLLIGLLYVHIIRVLLDVEYQLCKTMKVPNLTYVEVVRHPLENGPGPARKLTCMATFLVYFHYVVNGSLGNANYLIAIGDNFKMIIDYYFNVESNLIIIISIVIIPLLMIGCIRNLKFLAPLSVLTTLFNVINIILILLISPYYDKMSDLKAFNDITQFPVFFGIVLGAFTGTGMILPLKNDMKSPAKFSSPFGVLHIVLTLTMVLYAIFGFLGYLKFGSLVNPNILTNLPPDHYLTVLVLVLYSTGICVSYTLFVFIAFDTIWSNLFKKDISKMKYPLIKEYAIRIGLIILPYFLAVALPNYVIIASIGGVIGIIIDIGVPPILHVLLLWNRRQKRAVTKLIVFKDLIIIAMTLFLFISGIITVIQDIIEFYGP